MRRIILIFIWAFGSFSCEAQREEKHNHAQEPLNVSQLDTATFAGGCFWCVEAVFDRVEGVEEAVSGYSGGEAENANYTSVSRGQTNHAEAVEIYYNPEKITYKKLLEIFFATHDPTQLNRQGPDIGRQYRSEVFYHNETQKILTEEYILLLNASDEFPKDIVTRVNPYQAFYIAEDYHQDYYDHNPEDPYIVSVTKPKVMKFEKQFKDILKSQ